MLAEALNHRTEVEDAKQAALRYVDDRFPGIRRKRFGRGFAYIDPHGRPIHDPAELRRIKALAIPPAYVDVWICPIPNGHLQATARDARGRKQYRYHRRWREVRDEAKYRRTVAFARSLAALRVRVAADLAETSPTRRSVIATVVRLLDTTLARVGNEEYARDNASYGLTTLRTEHVRTRGGSVQLRFRGKSGVEHVISIHDRRLAAVIRRCRDLPGQELFSYVDDDGATVPVTSDDVNEYVREALGNDFTAKDFRTWHGTVLCALELNACTPAGTTAERRRTVSAAVKAVAARLRNTAAVCRACYVHPAVIDRFMEDGALSLPAPSKKVLARSGLSADEVRVLRLLEREARRDERAELRRKLRRSVVAARRTAA
ncbi:MAG: DNA topoisomerase IB [Candidatus Eremiobacteraeota bacterium]|nr:DNA topoisomerase IB [Candidatus Eremiobacteraeota bacterium]